MYLEDLKFSFIQTEKQKQPVSAIWKTIEQNGSYLLLFGNRQ